MLVAVAIPIVIAMQRVKLPALVGVVLTGIAIGPSALDLVRETVHREAAATES